MAEDLTLTQADEIFFGFPDREIAMYTSQVLTAIGDPAAWNAQADALSCYPTTDPIDRPLLLLGRARHLARNGEPDQAVHVAVTAIRDLAPVWRTPLLISEARALGPAITGTSTRAGHLYTEALRETVSASTPLCNPEGTQVGERPSQRAYNASN